MHMHPKWPTMGRSKHWVMCRIENMKQTQYFSLDTAVDSLGTNMPRTVSAVLYNFGVRDD